MIVNFPKNKAFNPDHQIYAMVDLGHLNLLLQSLVS